MNMQLHLQQVPARNGRLWIRHGFKVFQRAPLALASLFGLFLFVGFVAMLLPGVGLLLTLASLPLLSLGFMLATHLCYRRKRRPPASSSRRCSSRPSGGAASSRCASATHWRCC